MRLRLRNAKASLRVHFYFGAVTGRDVRWTAMKQCKGLRVIHSKRLPDIMQYWVQEKSQDSKGLEQVCVLYCDSLELNYVRVFRNNDVPWP